MNPVYNSIHEFLLHIPLMQTVRTLAHLLDHNRLLPLANLIHNRCLQLIDKCHVPNSDAVELMDDISNNLCSFLDPIEYVRLATTDQRLKESIVSCISILLPLIKQINSDSQLYAILKEFQSNNMLRGEKKAVADHLIFDFSQYGAGQENHQAISRLHHEHENLISSISSTFTHRSRPTLKSYHVLFKKRLELAKALGKSSFTQISQSRRMIKSKQEVLYILSKYENLQQEPDISDLFTTHIDENPNWCTLPNIINSFSDLCDMMFAVRLRIESDTLRVYDSKSNEFFGTIALDLRSKSESFISPSHFTLIGSKLNMADNLVLGRKIGRQHPIMLIRCAISNPNKISFSEMGSLFHELGHALHGMPDQFPLYFTPNFLGTLSTNNYQTLSGTRGPLDFAEYPSTLMEKFIQSRAFIKYLGASDDDLRRHEYWIQRDNRKLRRKTQHEIASTDLMLHGESAEIDSFFQNDTSSAKFNSSWICEIEHFNSYGGLYYTYLLADLLATKTMENIVKDRSLGAKIRQQLLSFGGSIDHLKVLNQLNLKI